MMDKVFELTDELEEDYGTRILFSGGQIIDGEYKGYQTIGMDMKPMLLADEGELSPEYSGHKLRLNKGEPIRQQDKDLVNDIQNKMPSLDIKDIVKSFAGQGNKKNESLQEGKQETFTSKEANELSKEFRDYLYNLDIPKYYDVRAEKVNDGEYIVRVNIEYGDLVHDHKYLDDMAKKFFNDKGINIMVYEPQELKSDIDEDNIYSSSHIIQKSGNKIYQVKKDDDFLEEEE